MSAKDVLFGDASRAKIVAGGPGHCQRTKLDT